MQDNSLTITLIQSQLKWEDKKANLEMFQQKIETLEEKTELVVLPEMFSTGFTMTPHGLAETMDGPTVQWMRDIAAKQKIILTGSIIIEEDGKYLNRLIWMLPNGQMGVYDKRHLFTFAGEDKNYSAGNQKLIASVNGFKVNLQICFDLRFPVWARQSPDSNMHYDIMINVANWPSRRSMAWRTLLHARAIENQCYVIGVNRVGEDGNHHYYSGYSQVVDPLGNILYEKSHDEDIYTFTIKKSKIVEMRREFPFLEEADDFIIQV